MSEYPNSKIDTENKTVSISIDDHKEELEKLKAEIETYKQKEQEREQNEISAQEEREAQRAYPKKEPKGCAPMNPPNGETTERKVGFSDYNQLYSSLKAQEDSGSPEAHKTIDALFQKLLKEKNPLDDLQREVFDKDLPLAEMLSQNYRNKLGLNQ
jgi:hypothetical protein